MPNIFCFVNSTFLFHRQLEIQFSKSFRFVFLSFSYLSNASKESCASVLVRLICDGILALSRLWYFCTFSSGQISLGLAPSMSAISNLSFLVILQLSGDWRTTLSWLLQVKCFLPTQPSSAYLFGNINLCGGLIRIWEYTRCRLFGKNGFSFCNIIGSIIVIFTTKYTNQIKIIFIFTGSASSPQHIARPHLTLQSKFT